MCETEEEYWRRFHSEVNALFAPSNQEALMKPCQYCKQTATCKLIWTRGAFGQGGPVTVPYCGKCSIKDALAKRGMTAPVTEGVDYKIERPVTT